MRKICKKLITIALGAVMAVSVVSVSSCAKNIKLDGDYSSGEVVSNGGFVVEKGNYIYFINGVDENTAENNGEAVKAALMRISTADFKAGNYTSVQTVVPSLMVAGDYTSGIYIYGDRVYYATPTNARNTSGEVENSYLDFKSTKLDGTDTVSNYYFRSSDNTAKYRFVEMDGVVYCLHVENGTDIYSYNTSTSTDTAIVIGASSIYFDETSTTSARVYYTMSVTVDIDTANSYTESYNQIYTATADAKTDSFDAANASYTVNGKTFSFDREYLEDNDEDFKKDDITTYPYVNLGNLVFDGKGKNNAETVYNVASADCFTPSGYTYSIVKADNGGLYYTRNYVDTTESTGDGGWLLYTEEKDFTSSSWNAIENNYRNAAGDKTDVIAYDTTNASSSAIFYEDNGVNYYIYVSGSAIYRNKVNEDGSVAEAQRIVNSAADSTLLNISSDGQFGYLYYYAAGTNGNALYRAVYNGSKEDYNVINKNLDYQPVKILNLDYHSSWYAPEIIENKLVFVNAESIGSDSYNYVYVMDMNGKEGLMTNREIDALNESYEDITTAISDMQSKYSALGNLMYYYYASNAFAFPEVDADEYYYEGTSDFYHSILAKSKAEGYSSTYLYSSLYQSEFDKFLAHEEGTLDDYSFTDENGEYYGVQSYFYSFMGQLTDADSEVIIDVWQNSMVLTITEDDSLETWQIVLIVVASCLGAIIVALAVIIPVRIHINKKKKRLAEIESAKPRKPKMDVDTTDDTSIDVYAVDETPAQDNMQETEEDKKDEE